MTRHLTTPNEYQTEAMLAEQDANSRAVANERASGDTLSHQEFKKRAMELRLACGVGQSCQQEVQTPST